MKLLLSNKSYTALYAEILALNNSAFTSSAPVITVSQHESAVGMVLMTTKRSISQPAWSKVISMRQHSAWYTAIDKVLARDSDGNEQPTWGRMIISPTGDEAHAVVVLLFMHKFDEIKDWLSLCRKYITKTEGAAVLLDPVYKVGTDPLDFWLNEDLLRLCEDPLKIVFKLLSHGQSRSVAGSFNAFLSFQILRAQKLKRVPHNLKVYPTLLAKAKAALRVTFTTNAEHAAGLRTVPFHAMERSLWVPPGGSAALAFEDVDKHLVSVREELAKAEDGEAVHQAPHLQPIVGQSSQSQSPASAQPPSHLAVVPTGQLVAAGGNLTASPASAPDKKLKAEKFVWPQGVVGGWGHQAIRWGVWRTDTGLVFGNRHVALRTGSLTVPQGSCLGCAAPNNSGKGNSAWCIAPLQCQNFASHDRQGNTTNADYEVTELKKDQDRTGWQVLVEPQSGAQGADPPVPPWPPSSGPGTTQGDGGAAAGKGKGQSKKRKGSQDFQRALVVDSERILPFDPTPYHSDPRMTCMAFG